MCVTEIMTQNIGHELKGAHGVAAGEEEEKKYKKTESSRCEETANISLPTHKKM